MTDAQKVARGQRAEKCLEEFVTPEFDYARRHYLDRIVEIAASELNPKTREEKITTLSLAIRVLDEVESGIARVFKEGEHVRAQLIKAERLEELTDPQRRLLAIAPRL